jgi:hypothetical protein
MAPADCLVARRSSRRRVVASGDGAEDAAEVSTDERNQNAGH